MDDFDLAALRQDAETIDSFSECTRPMRNLARFFLALTDPTPVDLDAAAESFDGFVSGSKFRVTLPMKAVLETSGDLARLRLGLGVQS